MSGGFLLVIVVEVSVRGVNWLWNVFGMDRWWCGFVGVHGCGVLVWSVIMCSEIRWRNSCLDFSAGGLSYVIALWHVEVVASTLGATRC